MQPKMTGQLMAIFTRTWFIASEARVLSERKAIKSISKAQMRVTKKENTRVANTKLIKRNVSQVLS